MALGVSLIATCKLLRKFLCGCTGFLVDYKLQFRIKDCFTVQYYKSIWNTS